jgi:hypothetical protein
MMKINKKEVVTVEGVNWKINIDVSTEDMETIDQILMEASTRAIEVCYAQNPENFQIGSYVQATLNKKTGSISRFVNSYHTLVNCSKFDIAETIRTYILNRNKVDIIKEDVFLTVQ